MTGNCRAQAAEIAEDIIEYKIHHYLKFRIMPVFCYEKQSQLKVN